jgi:hypothetical protein
MRENAIGERVCGDRGDRGDRGGRAVMRKRVPAGRERRQGTTGSLTLLAALPPW